MKPQCVVIAGPNGAGKSSSAPELLKDTLGVSAFVNADVIAQGLSGFRPEALAFEAGRIMRNRLDALIKSREAFAFETTLSGRSIERLMVKAAEHGFDVHVCYLWLPSADLAVARVRLRVALGGHDVPEDVIRRRYRRSLANAGRLVAEGWAAWRVYDGAAVGGPRILAHRAPGSSEVAVDPAAWATVRSTMMEAR